MVRFSPRGPCMDSSTTQGSDRSIENSLLTACAAAGSGKDPAETLRHLVQKCRDWAYLVQAAKRHGVTPLVSRRLDENAADIVPRDTLEILHRHFQANTRRNLFLTQELLSLVRRFNEHAIKVIPFKGPMLALAAYGNVGLREFLDLDLLVPRQQFSRARQLLEEWQYQPRADQTGAPGADHVEAQLGCDYMHPVTKISIELHWAFIQKWLGFEIDLHALWRAPDCRKVGGVSVLTLPADVTLLYLCAHGAKHRWTRLCWVVDVAQVLRATPDLDWPGLLQAAAHAGCRRTLFLGLHLAHTLLNVEIPGSILVKMKSDRHASRLATRICAGLFSLDEAPSRRSAKWSKDWFYLRTKERWRDRFRYLRYAAVWLFFPSPRDRQWLPLPTSLAWLYILVRPIRVACGLLHYGRSPTLSRRD